MVLNKLIIFVSIVFAWMATVCSIDIKSRLEFLIGNHENDLEIKGKLIFTTLVRKFFLKINFNTETGYVFRSHFLQSLY